VEGIAISTSDCSACSRICCSQDVLGYGFYSLLDDNTRAQPFANEIVRCLRAPTARRAMNTLVSLHTENLKLATFNDALGAITILVCVVHGRSGANIP